MFTCDEFRSSSSRLPHQPEDTANARTGTRNQPGIREPRVDPRITNNVDTNLHGLCGHTIRQFAWGSNFNTVLEDEESNGAADRVVAVSNGVDYRLA